MLNFSTEIILLCFDKMKDVTLIDSIIAKKQNKTKQNKKQTNKHWYSQVDYSELQSILKKNEIKKYTVVLKNVLKILHEERKSSLH